MTYDERGSGRTTRQMLAAPKDAIFICAGPSRYSKALARFLGRDDLKIYSPEVLERSMGLRPTGLVIDHAADLTERQEELARSILATIPPVKGE